MSIPSFPEMPSNSNTVSHKKFKITWALSLLFGLFGADRFYLGKTKSGIIKLLTVGGFIFWAIFDVIQLLADKTLDSNGNKVTTSRIELRNARIITAIFFTLFLIGSFSDLEKSKDLNETNFQKMEFSMPLLVTKDLDVAIEELKSLGVLVGRIKITSNEVSGTIDAFLYEVCEQSPGWGSSDSSNIVLNVASDCSATSSPSGTPTDKEVKNTIEEDAIVVPDGVGMDYQSAQDLWRAVGLFVLPATDATGQGRLAWLDSNWYVVSQYPPAGTRVPENSDITASIKKYTD